MTKRESICEIARSWLNTPYVSHQCLKHVGVDCCQFSAAVYKEAGYTSVFIPKKYTMQCYLHRDAQDYRLIVENYADEITRMEAKPGDMILFKIGRGWGHSAIILECDAKGPSKCIHSYGCGVQYSNPQTAGFLRFNDTKYYRIRGVDEP